MNPNLKTALSLKDLKATFQSGVEKAKELGGQATDLLPEGAQPFAGDLAKGMAGAAIGGGLYGLTANQRGYETEEEFKKRRFRGTLQTAALGGALGGLSGLVTEWTQGEGRFAAGERWGDKSLPFQREVGNYDRQIADLEANPDARPPRYIRPKVEAIEAEKARAIAAAKPRPPSTPGAPATPGAPGTLTTPSEPVSGLPLPSTPIVADPMTQWDVADVAPDKGKQMGQIGGAVGGAWAGDKFWGRGKEKAMAKSFESSNAASAQQAAKAQAKLDAYKAWTKSPDGLKRYTVPGNAKGMTATMGNPVPPEHGTPQDRGFRKKLVEGQAKAESNAKWKGRGARAGRAGVGSIGGMWLGGLIGEHGGNALRKGILMANDEPNYIPPTQ